MARTGPKGRADTTREPSSRSHTRRAKRKRFIIVYVLVGLLVVAIGIQCFKIAVNLQRHIERTKAAAAADQIAALKTAIFNYRLKFKQYPASLQDLVNNPKQNFLDIESVPMDPWGNPYLYASPGRDGHEYDVICLGADGEPGGEGMNADIASWDARSLAG